MKKTSINVDEIIGRKDLVEKWIEQRKKETTMINIADIFLLEKIHRGKFNKGLLPKKAKDITEAIIVRPDKYKKERYILVRGWRLYHCAQIIGQEQINAYITHSGRDEFAKKLLRYEEDEQK